MLRFQARRHRFTFPGPAVVMGVLNVTPDSFSDGGKYIETGAAVAHGQSMAGQGAGIIDVGGESTRPGAEPVEEDQELRRVIPVIKSLARAVPMPISIDTMKPAVARAAVGAGASIINDVGANRTDPEMWEVVAETGAGYVCMHMQGTPRVMQHNPSYKNVVAEVQAFFVERLAALRQAGVAPEQVVLDPGIGFGKKLEHNLQLLASLAIFNQLHRPLLIGVSRKSFMGKLLGAGVADRLPAALACACLAREAGVQMFRVHDVAETVQALRMTEAVLSEKESRSND